MKHLIIHIGTGKTGSTAIQQALAQSAQGLREKSVHYWGLNLEGAQSTDPFPWQREGGTSDLQKLTDEIAERQLTKALNEAVEKLPKGATAVWSNESIYERPNTYIRLLKEIQGDQLTCKVVAYARSHREYINSAYKQWGIKHKTYRGPLLGFSDWVLARREFLSYGGKLAQWDAAFADQFRLANYDKITDVVEHFNKHLPNGCCLEAEKQRRINRSPEPAILALHALHNSQFNEPVTPTPMVELLRQFPRVRQLQKVPSLESLFPDADQLTAAEQVIREDSDIVNAMLRRHGEPALTKEDLDQPKGNLSRDDISTDILAALMHILVEQNNRIVELEQTLLKKGNL